MPSLPANLDFNSTKQEKLKYFADILRHFIFKQVKSQLFDRPKKASFSDMPTVQVHKDQDYGILLLIR